MLGSRSSANQGGEGDVFYKPISCLAHRSETQAGTRNLYAMPSLPVVLFIIPEQLVLCAHPPRAVSKPLPGAMPKKESLSPPGL